MTVQRSRAGPHELLRGCTPRADLTSAGLWRPPWGSWGAGCAWASLGKQRPRLAPSAWLCDAAECSLDATVAGEGGQLKQLLFELEP